MLVINHISSDLHLFLRNIENMLTAPKPQTPGKLASVLKVAYFGESVHNHASHGAFSMSYASDELSEAGAPISSGRCFSRFELPPIVDVLTKKLIKVYN